MTRITHTAAATLGALLVSKAMLPVVPPARATFPGIGGEVWIASTTNTTGCGYTAGSGSQASPYVGDLDAIKRGLPLLCRVHLMAGDFWTKAGWDAPLKSWQHWSGAGMYATRVHADRRYSAQQGQSVFASYDNGITIEDMTLDASGQDGDPWQRNGLDLFGQHISVRRVKVINCAGNRRLERECFPIFVGIGSQVPSPDARSIITECEVSSCHGDYITAINLNGQGVVSFCRVELPFILDPRVSSGWTAYNSSGGENTLFIGNISEGGWYGYYTDTGSETNLSLIGNTFRNCQAGIVVNKYTTGVDGMNVSENTIELATNATRVNAGVGVGLVNFGSNGVLANIRICGNIVRYRGGVGPAGNAGIEVNGVVGNVNVHGVIVNGNQVATNMSTRVVGIDVPY